MFEMCWAEKKGCFVSAIKKTIQKQRETGKTGKCDKPNSVADICDNTDINSIHFMFATRIQETTTKLVDNFINNIIFTI